MFSSAGCIDWLIDGLPRVFFRGLSSGVCFVDCYLFPFHCWIVYMSFSALHLLVNGLKWAPRHYYTCTEYTVGEVSRLCITHIPSDVIRLLSSVIMLALCLVSVSPPFFGFAIFVAIFCAVLCCATFVSSRRGSSLPSNASVFFFRVHRLYLVLNHLCVCVCVLSFSGI